MKFNGKNKKIFINKIFLSALSTLEIDFPEGIPQCGTDALRFTLASYTQQGRNINMDVNRVFAIRKFCNKIWNATLYILTQFQQNKQFIPDSLTLTTYPLEFLTMIDKWIMNRLAITTVNSDKALKNFDFFTATHAIYSFFLYDLCDHYIEFTKLLFYKKYSHLSENQYKVNYLNHLLIKIIRFVKKLYSIFCIHV